MRYDEKSEFINSKDTWYPMETIFLQNTWPYMYVSKSLLSWEDITWTRQLESRHCINGMGVKLDDVQPLLDLPVGDPKPLKNFPLPAEAGHVCRKPLAILRQKNNQLKKITNI